MESFITITAVDRIAGLPDPVLRNLQITQSYHELSAAFARRTGLCANWCTFATWASRQAGQTIRREDLAHALENSLKTSPEIAGTVAEVAELFLKKNGAGRESMLDMVWQELNPSAAMERSASAVARGNRKVYAEIGREFARFIATCSEDKTYDGENLALFSESLRPGDPPDGQEYLRRAFTHYYQAFFETDPKQRAQRILLANLQIGFHEQTRLQPEIAEALDAAVPETYPFKHRMLKLLFPRSWWLWYVGSLFSRLTGRPTPLDRAIALFLGKVRLHIRRFLTDRLMTLDFPNRMLLRLGDDLRAEIPLVFRQITFPELGELLKKIDPTPGSLRDSGAVDWADLPDRIHYIADLFRCYHQKADLLSPPFSPGQVREIYEGHVPLNERL